MITARRKPLDKILSFIAPYKKVLLLGCGSCVAVCFTGGEKETEELACVLPLMAREKGLDLEIRAATCTRVCDWEFVEPVLADDEKPDAIVTLSCGTGVNLLADRIPDIRVFPGTDTLFMGANVEHGVWKEYCSGCGDCVLDRTFGICPVARCSKSIMNGPCGGSNDGSCEIDPDTECGWIKIIERGQSLGHSESLTEYVPPKNWGTSQHGGPRRLIREDLKIVDADE
jgi:ferredoxin